MINTTKMKIQQHNSETKGYFSATEGEVEAGRMTYSWAGADKIIVDHTEVNPDFKGKGVGNQILMAVVDFARNNGIRIIPLCPFAKSVFDKNAEIRDVL